jgi:hypothetical protein
MGIIASLKVGYKLSMLERLLAIFDVEGGNKKAVKAGRRQKLSLEEKFISLMQ